MNPTYEIVQQTTSDYCAARGFAAGGTVVGTTTGTSFTYTISPSDVVVAVFVRLASDPCIVSNNGVYGDSFTTLPSKPPPPTVSSSGLLSVSYSDPRAASISFQRAGATDFNFQSVANADVCQNPKTAGDNAAPGVYR